MFIILFGIVCLMKLTDGKGINLFIAFALIAGATLLSSVIEFFRGKFYFYALRRIAEDKSERAIFPLFDNGYSSELVDEKSLFSDTREIIKGNIMGVPVELSLNSPYRYGGGPELKLCFIAADESFGKPAVVFSLDMALHLKKDIKPEVLQFVSDLKAKGYRYWEEVNPPSKT
jgi:hypothetical protein